jgi:hypothetical protein
MARRAATANPETINGHELQIVLHVEAKVNGAGRFAVFKACVAISRQTY